MHQFKALCALAIVGTLASSEAGAVEPVVTRQQEFAIPYRMTRDRTAREVRLFVSSDQGKTWRLISRAQPHVRNFRYRAPADGEYWFAIRTLHDGGQHLPADPLQAELRVVVDTIEPRLDLVASRGADGEIKVAWRAVDPNLKPGSLKIETRSSGSSASDTDVWQPLAIGPSPKSVKGTRTGEAKLWPAAAAKVIAVRAAILDTAGNRNISQTEVALSDSRSDSSLVSMPGGDSSWRPVPPISSHETPVHPPSGAPSSSQIWPPDHTSARPLGR